MSRGALFRTGLLLAIPGAAALGWWVLEGRLNPAAIEAAMREAGWLAPAMFVALFVLATLLIVPGSIFGLAGGARPGQAGLA
jgi:uncharacterized membrane protein YdjX (TVP38/TMEM64 family)